MCFVMLEGHLLPKGHRVSEFDAEVEKGYGAARVRERLAMASLGY